MHGKIKLKLENESYRDKKCMTQTAWMTRTNENYKSESIQIKSIPIKSEKSIQKQKTNEKYANEKKVFDWKNAYETKLYE